MAPTAQKFAQHVVPQVIKPARVVWNQVIGVVFLVFGIPVASRAVTSYRLIATDPRALVQFLLLALFAAILIAFGVGSFLRARKISRQ